MSSLPARLQAVVPLMNQARPGHDPFDPAFREALLQWGLDQIAREIQPDPVYRPLDYPRKLAAEREWRRVVRDQGKAQRTLVAGFQTTMAQEAFNDILFEIGERRRRSAVGWDKEQRIDEYKQTSEWATDQEIRKMEAAARLASAHQPPPPADPMTLIKQIQFEIEAIDVNPTYSEEQKHRKTQVLYASLNQLLGAAGKSNRG